MNIKVLSFLAWRYLRGTSFSSSINTMIKISYASIVIGTFSLTLVSSIMQGFEEETCKKLKGIAPDMSIESPNQEPLELEALIARIKKECPEAIASSSPYTTCTVLATRCATDTDQAAIGFLKVVDPARTGLNKLNLKLTPQTSLHALLAKKGVIIGTVLQKSLGCTLGSCVELLYQEDQTTHGSTKKITLPVTGVIATGIAEIDEHLMLCSFETFATFIDQPEPTGLALEFHNKVNHTHCKELLERALPGLRITSWKDDYPALVSALTLERYVMFFLLSLITLVASMNLLSLLFMILHSKRTDCALLISLGCSPGDLKKIFLAFTLFLSCAACATGIFLAYAAAFFLKVYPFIELPDAYYVSHLPVSISWYTGAVVGICALVLSVLAGLFALRTIPTVDVARILRYE